LEKAGIIEAEIPKPAALLYLRNSEDWYQAKSWYGQDIPPDKDKAVEGIRGFVAHRQIGSLLIEKGLPYEIVFLDRHKINRLDQYKILLLPFPYSLSKENIGLIENAVRNGSRLLVFEKQGETDEWGEPVKEPGLAELIKKYPDRVSFFPDSLYDMDAEYQRKVVDVIRKSSPEIPLLMDADGARIEAFLLENPKENRYFLSLVNWERKTARCKLSLSLKPGDYEILLRDETGFKKVLLNGNRTSSASDLASLDLELGPGTFKVIIFRRI
jgi:hypothetical protein